MPNWIIKNEYTYQFVGTTGMPTDFLHEARKYTTRADAAAQAEFIDPTGVRGWQPIHLQTQMRRIL